MKKVGFVPNVQPPVGVAGVLVDEGLSGALCVADYPAMSFFFVC